MTYLTSHLPFPPSSSSSASTSTHNHTQPTSQSLPPSGSHLIISDTLNSPGDFALYHLVSASISRKQPVVWVDFRNEGRSSWEAVMKRLGTPIPAGPTSSKSFTHINPTSCPTFAHNPQSSTSISAPPSTSTSTSTSPSTSRSPALFSKNGEPSLKETYDSISICLPSRPRDQGVESTMSGPSVENKDDVHHPSESIVILDGLSELIWMGFSVIQISQFVRAILGLTRKTNSILVSTIHADLLPPHQESDSPNAELLERLIRIGGGGRWSISSLESGRSGDVMGEISSHPLFPPSSTTSGTIPTFPSVPREKPLQYRIENNTVKCFPKGTGRGFL